jgi:hypothetical protein
LPHRKHVGGAISLGRLRFFRIDRLDLAGRDGLAQSLVITVDEMRLRYRICAAGVRAGECMGAEIGVGLDRRQLCALDVKADLPPTWYQPRY